MIKEEKNLTTTNTEIFKLKWLGFLNRIGPSNLKFDDEIQHQLIDALDSDNKIGFPIKPNISNNFLINFVKF